MSKKCVVTGKRPMTGNHVSHAHNKTKRVFKPNLQSKRYWVASQGRYIRLKLSIKGLRMIDKLGIDHLLNTIKRG